MSGDWYRDGPMLPVEFARVSREMRPADARARGRRASATNIVWAVSQNTTLEEAAAGSPGEGRMWFLRDWELAADARAGVA